MHFKDKVFLSEALNHLFTAINYWNCYWAVPEMKQRPDLSSVSSKHEFWPTRSTKNHLHPLHSPSSSRNSAKRTLRRASNRYRNSGKNRISGSFIWPLSSMSTTPKGEFSLGCLNSEVQGEGLQGSQPPGSIYYQSLKKSFHWLIFFNFPGHFHLFTKLT